MIFLNTVAFKRDVEYDLTSESQRSKFKTSVEISDSPRDRGKKYEYFKLFEKDFAMDFSDITVIVGDNGTGKTSLLKQLELPSFRSAFGDEGRIKEILQEYVDNKTRTLKFKKMPPGVLFLDDLHKGEIRNRLKSDIDLKQSNGSLQIQQLVHFLQSGSDSNGEVLKDLYKELHDMEDSIIVFDEPETSLSLNSISDLRAQLRILAEKNQVIISTHNPFIMRLAKSVYDMEAKAYVDTEKYLSKYGM